MKFSAKQYALALLEALEGIVHKDHNQILDNFVKVLAENNDLRIFEQIVEEFHRLELEKKGKKLAEVTSARPINRENEHAIVEELNKFVKKDVELKKKVDENLIGGVVIQMDDQMIDATVKANLEKLKKELTK